MVLGELVGPKKAIFDFDAFWFEWHNVEDLCYVSFSPYLLTVLSSCSEQHSYHCDVNAPPWVLETISLLAKSVTTHISFLWPLPLVTAAVVFCCYSFYSCQYVFKNSFTVILVEFQERVDASTWAQPGISDFLDITFSYVICILSCCEETVLTLHWTFQTPP